MGMTRLVASAAACGLLAACGHQRQRAYEVLRTNPTVYVAIQPISMAGIAAARLQEGTTAATNWPTLKFIFVSMSQGDMACVYERECDLPPKSTCQPMTVGQLMGALTNAPTANGIIYRLRAFTTNELACLRPRMVARPDEELRIRRAR